MFEKLADISNIKAPTFAFAHIIIPHPRYIFGPNGEEIKEVEALSIRKQGAVSWRSRYLDQLIFANKKTKELVDTILSNSDIASFSSFSSMSCKHQQRNE